MANTPPLVARRIQEIRESKKLSRQELALKLQATGLEEWRNTTRLQVWRLETGVTEVSADAVAAFATALEVPVGAFYGDASA